MNLKRGILWPSLALILIPSRSIAYAQEAGAVAPGQEGLIVLAAAIAAAAALVAAAISLGIVGVAAIGAIAERPEISSITFVYVVFIEAIGIYGLVLAFLILGRV